ncbi:MAG: hypothetical protein JXR60_04945 [Bacteroidales bacterium]|nr:hypothetical protein [Bacteroidales bacterium]
MQSRITIIILGVLALFSCKKENEDYPLPNNNYPNIAVDSLNYSFWSEAGLPYYEGYFNSANQVKNFNLKLYKNKQYRIFSSQQFDDTTYVRLALKNEDGNTITLSQVINHQSILYFNSPSDKTYLLSTQLDGDYHLSTDFKLFFEERQYNTLLYKQFNWSYYGNFKVEADSLHFIPSGSFMQRWLQVDSSIENSKNISVEISSDNEFTSEFGFTFSAYRNSANGGYSDDNIVHGTQVYFKNDKFYVYYISDNGTSLLYKGNLGSWSAMPNRLVLNIETDSSDYLHKLIYLNNMLITEVNNVDYNDFYFVFSDRTEERISISDLTIE